MAKASLTLVCVLAVLALSSMPADAIAAPPPPSARFGDRVYLQLSPGIASVIIAEHRFADDARWAWPWSIGAGRMFTRGPWFKATFGASLEHRVFFVEGGTPHGVHALLESRIGAGTKRFWGYGLVGLGAAATIVDWKGDHAEDFYGIVVQLGGGVQWLIGRRFFAGGELDLDLGYDRSVQSQFDSVKDFDYHTLTLELVVGWYF